MSRSSQLSGRQRFRKALLFISLLLFPVTLYYFSPVIIVESAAQGIINASCIVFGLMFVAALFVGRLWCGWACPAGGLQEFGSIINSKTARGNWIKWVIWIPWIGLIAVLVVRAGGYHAIDPFYHLEGGVTLMQPVDPEGPPWYVIYYVIVFLFLGLALIFGRRASCHTICWMAPFMIVGRRLRNILRWPALRLRVEPERCADCLACTRSCPMSLDVNRMVRSGDMENDECILCGTCADTCPKDVIHFSFGAGR